MWSRVTARITVILVLSWFQLSDAKTATLDPGTIQMLSNILDSLDNFRNDRLRDLEKIKLSTGNSSSVERSDPVSLTSQNSSVSEHIQALKEGILGHNPVKKTFGYKVTVYTTPIEEGNKEGKPVLVTQYVGGDMAPQITPKKTNEQLRRRTDESDDLQESANNPKRQLIHSSESAHLPIQVAVSNIGGGDGHESSAVDGASDHNRKTEHSEHVEKGHQNGHLLHTNLAKAHDHEKHSAKHDEHHKETEKQSHRHDEQAHDKGGATQQGIRERTEIEYYEREHFLDTEYDKAKKGHDKTSGVKEHERHNDYDSHDNKKLHAQENTEKHKIDTGASTAKANANGVLTEQHHHVPHYSPPISVHYNEAPHHEDHRLKEDSHALKGESSKLHHSEESKGHREHNDEKDVHSEHKDSGYLDKHKGRRKEGYRERGYKITAEREYFLNDAHHDKGQSSHTSGHRLKDQEDVAQGSKDGERDRGFVKEEKKEEAHDAAYDSKDKQYFDGEEHKEGFKSEKSASSSGGEKKEEDVISLVPPVVNYVEEYPHSPPLYPLPIAYAPSNDGAQVALAYPPENLKPKKKPTNAYGIHSDYGRHPRNEKLSQTQKQQTTHIGFDDDHERQSTGYIGHASYKKRPSPLVSSIRDNVRKDVHAKPPTYSKPQSTSSEENSVRFPEEKDSDDERDSSKEESSHEVIFPKEEEKQQLFTNPPPRYEKDGGDYQLRPPYSQQEEKHLDSTKLRNEAPYVPEKERLYSQPHHQQQIVNKGHGISSHLPIVRESPRFDPRAVYLQGAQNANKLVSNLDRGAYPQIKTLPTVGDLIDELSRQQQAEHKSQPYTPEPQRSVDANAQLAFTDLQRIYNLNGNTPQQVGYQVPTHQTRTNPSQGHYQQQQQQQLGSYPQNPHQQLPRGTHVLHLQQDLPRTMTTLEHLQQQQQQTKPPFSPVVLLSQGPPAQRQNQAVDVWYTRSRT